MKLRQTITALICAGLSCFSPVTRVEADTFPIPFNVEAESTEVAVVLRRRPFRTRDLPWGPLRDARRQMNAGEEISEDDLRAIAEYGDGLAAHKYVQILTDRGIRNNASDVAFFSAIALETGRIWPLDEFVIALRHLDPETEPDRRVQRYISVLYPYAWAGNRLALEAVIEHNGEGRLFGALSTATAERIRETRESVSDDYSIIRETVTLLEQDYLTASERLRVIGYLSILKASESLPLRTAGYNLSPLIENRIIVGDDVPIDGDPAAAQANSEPAELDQFVAEQLGQILQELEEQ